MRVAVDCLFPFFTVFFLVIIITLSRLLLRVIITDFLFEIITLDICCALNQYLAHLSDYIAATRPRWAKISCAVLNTYTSCKLFVLKGGGG